MRYKLGCRGVSHDYVPDEMASLEGNGIQDQLQCVSMRFFLVKDVPRLTWCVNRDSQEQVSDECQN